MQDHCSDKGFRVSPLTNRYGIKLYMSKRSEVTAQKYPRVTASTVCLSESSQLHLGKKKPGYFKCI